MPKRSVVDESSSEPLAKKTATFPKSPTADVKSGMIFTDISGKKWRLGKTVGTGGFGEIFLVSDIINREVTSDAQYVAKVESHTSGPLFVEIHCYLKLGKLDMIKEWKNVSGAKHLGIPHHVAFGSHIISGMRYRFLIIPRFESDLEKMFVIKRHKFNLKTVLTISLQIMDVLQYIHSKGYLHLDIKASNIGFNMNKKPIPLTPTTAASSKSLVRYHGFMPARMCKAKKTFTLTRVLRPNTNLKRLCLNDVDIVNTNINENMDRVYLLDYGLACRYVGADGSHKEFSKDERRAHAGTLLFCSRDAHLGAQSRRSDLECLGYNLLYWLTSNLPWSENSDNPQVVYKKKSKCMTNLKEFLDFSFNYESPKFLYEYFNYLLKLEFEEEPDYNFCKTIFRKALKEYGYKDDMRLDFDNSQGWRYKQKKVKRTFENYRIQCAIQKFNRTPLTSNRPIRPILRKEIINKKLKRRLNWSRILLDPEILMKKAKSRSRERKLTESMDANHLPSSIMNLDINQLNPNTTMLKIFNRAVERSHNMGGISPNRKDDNTLEAFEGYTPAMMEVYNRIQERKELHDAELTMKRCNSSKSVRSKSKRKFSCCNTSHEDYHSIKCDASKKKERKNRTVNSRKMYSLRG